MKVTLPRQRRQPLRPGHLNFKHRYKEVHPRVTTLDEAVDLIERRARSKLAVSNRDKDAPKKPASLQQTFAIAKAISSSRRSKAKVKMPEFSIQKIE